MSIIAHEGSWCAYMAGDRRKFVLEWKGAPFTSLSVGAVMRGRELFPLRWPGSFAKTYDQIGVDDLLSEREKAFSAEANHAEIHRCFPQITAVLALNEFNLAFNETFASKSAWHGDLYHYARRIWGDPNDAVRLLVAESVMMPAELLPYQEVLLTASEAALADKIENKSTLSQFATFGDWA